MTAGNSENAHRLVSEPYRDDLEQLAELRDLWMSRLMFNLFVGWPAETRSFAEFEADFARQSTTASGRLPDRAGVPLGEPRPDGRQA